MKINKYGKVIITEDEVLVTGFEFECPEGCLAAMDVAQKLALEWAMERLNANQT